MASPLSSTVCEQRRSLPAPYEKYCMSNPGTRNEESDVDRSDLLSKASSCGPSKPVELMSCEVVFCYTCKTIHKCPDVGNTLDIGGAKCAANRQRAIIGAQCSFGWWKVHLEMRAHRASSQYQSGERHFGKKFDWIAGMWQGDLQCVVRDERLLMKLQASKKFELDNVHDGIEQAPHCRHWYMNPGYEMIWTDILKQFLTAGGIEYKSQLFRCECCPTEYRFFVERSCVDVKEPLTTFNGSSGHEYKFTIITYTDFGECESPLSREWYVLYHHHPPPNYTRPHHTCLSRFLLLIILAQVVFEGEQTFIIPRIHSNLQKPPILVEGTRANRITI